MFINLHAHGEFSTLDGLGTAKQRAERAKELNQSALSISDHGTLSGVPHHIDACNEAGVKPVVGIEAYFKPDRFKQDNNNKKAWHLLLLAQNEAGWKNLIKLSTESHLTGFYYKPCMDWELLKKYSEGVICSSACVSGYLPWLLQHGEDHEITECVERNLSIYGEENYYLEIMPHDFPAQKLVNNRLQRLSHKYDLPLLATADSHYPYKDWKDTQDVVLMIATGQTRNQRKRKKDAGEDVYEMNVPLHMFSEDEMYEMFAVGHKDLTKQSVEQSINNTLLLADKIEPFEIDKSNKLPKAGKDKADVESTLIKWCNAGMNRIGKQDDPVYKARLEHEIKTLQNVGVIDYFVIVGEMVRWARAEGIRISSGRGSASGSLVCYLINITTIDPIAHDLLFERFLNPDRKGLPDIDLDFEHARRDEVKDWLRNRYGEDHVCDISAFDTYKPRAVIKDVSRVLDVSYAETNTVTKLIPEPPNIPPLQVIRENNVSINSYAKKYPEVWKHALRLEGQIKGLSKHAGGVVVTDKPITEYMPLMQGKSGVITSWSERAEAPYISIFNFLKIDILSLESLSKQGNTVRLIKQEYGIDIDLDELSVATDPNNIDPKVMEIFRKGNTLGIFQFGGSKGIMSFLKMVKPDRFEDLVAINALYRPGPIEGGDAYKYGDLKHGKIPPQQWHESINKFLDKTYGIIVYQEQLQQIAQYLGNLSPGESDDFRKATSKLYRISDEEAKDFMRKYEDQFIAGCIENGLNKEDGYDVWERMLAFGAYSFNRSHSSSYSLAGYQDAYLKAYFPEAFYASLLSSEEDKDKFQEAVREGRNLDVKILTPNINNSKADFTITDEGLRYGLLSVKWVGDAAIDEIMEKRPFKNYEDFRERVEPRRCNKTGRDNLMKSGAFDEFGERDHFTTAQKRDFEIESIGIAISGAGEVIKYENIIEPRITSEIEFEQMKDGQGLTIGGEISNVTVHKIKKGKNAGKDMGYVTISYKENSWESVFFNNQWNKFKSILKTGGIVMARGRKSDTGQVLIDNAVEIDALLKLIEDEKESV